MTVTHNRKKQLGVPVNTIISAGMRQVLSLNGAWTVKIDPDNRGMAEAWAQQPLASTTQLEVPGCVQSLDELATDYPPARGLHNTYAGTTWWEYVFDCPDIDQQRRIWLKCGGIAPSGHVWINGSYTGTHKHSPVAAKWDITDQVHPGAMNRVTIAVVEQDTGLLGGLRFAGQRWSGLFRAVEVEITHRVHLEEVFIRPNAAKRRITISAKIHNDSPVEVDVTPSLAVTSWPEEHLVGDHKCEHQAVAPGAVQSFTSTMELPEAELWSTEQATLHVATLSLALKNAQVDAVAIRFGLRTFEVIGSQLSLNGHPFMARGAGQEYFSPTLSPLVDRAILRDRLTMLKDYGFNFFRCHTYPAMPEELEVADELGMIYAPEISLVSNFNKTEPFEDGLDVLRAYIIQTRNHPSLGVYGLGNEGSQLMVKSETERIHAAQGYAGIKEAAPDHLAMIAFGLQGEIPELPNDIESPHLWSHDFRWGYEGLSRIPWQALQVAVKAKPCIVHEYGKFGLWPDPEEQDLYPPNGYAHPFGNNAQAALVAAGLDHLESQIIRNARRLYDVCCRNIIEQARRQPSVDGYVMWTAFRNGARNSGFADDIGRQPNCDPARYRTGCNAPLAVLIDRDFQGRTLRAGAQTEIGVYISNFGQNDLDAATISWEILHEDTEASLRKGDIREIHSRVGQNTTVGSIRFQAPSLNHPLKLMLHIELMSKDQVLAQNHWRFWLFPSPWHEHSTRIVTDFEDTETERRFAALFPQTISLQDVDSMVRGCRTWDGQDIHDTLARFSPDVLVADRWSKAVIEQLSLGRTVLLLDTGHYPERWYPTPIPNAEGLFDVNTAFTSFRAGWDQGNLATVITDHKALGDFPHDGFCDLQFYTMVQHARPLRTSAVCPDIGNTRQVIIRSVPKLKFSGDAGPPVQDPNAIQAKQLASNREIATDDRAYVLTITPKQGQILICSLRCLDDPAGHYLLRQMLHYAATKKG